MKDDTANITLYTDLFNILAERGYTDDQAMEIITKLTAQAEMEVVEEILGRFSEDQLKVLDEIPENASASEIAEKLNLNGEEIDIIRAQKTAELIKEMVPALNEDYNSPPTE